MANMSKPDKVDPSFRLACPFALQNQEHYKDAHTSNCTTHRGFANRQLLKQHIISEHLALCPKCFELKKTDSKGKEVPDKKIESVLPWRRAHLETCKGSRGSRIPEGRYPMNDAQTNALEALDHKKLVPGERLATLRDPRDYDFEWWRQVFRALYPSVSNIPQPDTRFFVPRMEIDKEVLRIAEIIVHAAEFGQVGLPTGVSPDPYKYQQLDPHVLELLAPTLDILRAKMLPTNPGSQPNSDSGYGSHPGDLSSSPPRSPKWDYRMDLDDDRQSGGDFSQMGAGMRAPDRLPDHLIRELTSELRRSQR